MNPLAVLLSKKVIKAVSLVAVYVLLTQYTLIANTPCPDQEYCLEKDEEQKILFQDLCQAQMLGADQVEIIEAPLFGQARVDSSEQALYYKTGTRFFVKDSFRYQICPSGGICDTGKIVIYWKPSNQLFTRRDLGVVLTGDTLEGNMLYNDNNFRADDLVLYRSFLVSPMHGKVILHKDGSYTYIPNTGYVGQDQFSYLVCGKTRKTDCEKNVVTIMVIDKVSDCEHALIAVDDYYAAPLYTAFEGNVLPNDVHYDLGTVTVNPVPVGTTRHGRLELSENGNFVYEQTESGFVYDQFSYEVCMTSYACQKCDTATVFIRPDDALVPCQNWRASINEDVFGGCKNATIEIDPLANDVDFDKSGGIFCPDPDFLPTHGSLSNFPSGVLTYTPDADFTGVDKFGYHVCYPTGECVKATVHIIVKEPFAPSIKNDLYYITTSDCQKLDIAANDVMLDGMDMSTFRVNKGGSSGTFNIQGSVLEYCPDPAFLGKDTVDYEMMSLQTDCQLGVLLKGRIILDRSPFLRLQPDLNFQVERGVEGEVILSWIPDDLIEGGSYRIVRISASRKALPLSGAQFFEGKYIDQYTSEESYIMYRLEYEQADERHYSEWRSIEVQSADIVVFGDGMICISGEKWRDVSHVDIVGVQGTSILSGMGDQNCWTFQVPATGIYIVTYQYRGKASSRKVFLRR